MSTPIPFDDLAESLAGELATDAATRGVYATDASVYQVMPQAVAFPKHAADCREIVAFCALHRLPITGRGGGTSLSGQAIGPGLVVDFSRHMNKVLEVAADGSWVRAQPGVVLDELNKRLAPLGTHFAPDPATGSRATLGGMIGNNSCGTRSIVYGRTGDAVMNLRLLLSDGVELNLPRLDAAQWREACAKSGREGALYRGVEGVIERHRDEIKRLFPLLPRVVAGYALNQLTDGAAPRSLAALAVGGEGTLGLVLEATLRLTPLPKATSLVVIGFDTLDAALVPLPEMLKHKPSAIELLDQVVITEALRNASTRELAAFLLASGKAPFACHLCEFFGNTAEEAEAKARAFMAACQAKNIGSSHILCLDKAAQHRAWEVRRLGLGLISNTPGKAKGVSTIEDACVPVDKLAEYSRFVYACCEKHGIHTATYAHASVGVLHFKAMLDLHEEPDRAALRAVGEECFAECKRLGGVFSGEHGDGIVRGEFVEKQFGPALYQAFREIKTLFDPAGLMNPGRKLDAPPLDGPLRYGANGPMSDTAGWAPKDYPRRIAEVNGHFRHGEQGGIAGAIEQCNGVGACRKLGSGNMCPSFRATGDENHTTRGRANALRLAITGQLGGKNLADPGLHETLELCLSCKACKAECPNAVDMARLKSEALQARWDADGVSPKARLVADLPKRAAQFAGTLAPMFNAVSKIGMVRSFMEKRYGVDRRRALPALAATTLDDLLKGKGLPSPASSRPAKAQTVALFADTWMRFFEPHIGLATVEFLESCGFKVILTRSHDSQRTKLSTGLVREAKAGAAKVFDELRRFQEAGIPVVCVEPSDCSSLTDDLPDLLDDAPMAAMCAANVHLIDDFIAAKVAKGLRLRPVRGLAPGQTMLHPHCHQRTLFAAAAPKKILEAAGFSVDAPETGCCGMAGAFGYAHHDLSGKIGEDRLFPAVRTAVERRRQVIATGTSCRAQLHDFLRVEAAHWVELVRGMEPT